MLSVAAGRGIKPASLQRPDVDSFCIKQRRRGRPTSPVAADSVQRVQRSVVRRRPSDRLSSGLPRDGFAVH